MMMKKKKQQYICVYYQQCFKIHKKKKSLKTVILFRNHIFSLIRPIFVWNDRPIENFNLNFFIVQSGMFHIRH